MGKRQAGAVVVVLGALVWMATLTCCVGDSSNPALLAGDGGISPTLPDGAPNLQFDGGNKPDGSVGPSGCAPCVLGKSQVGNCCVQ